MWGVCWNFASQNNRTFQAIARSACYTDNMKALTIDSLVDLLASVKGATFATLITETDARLKKTGNPFGDVRKVSRVNVCLGFQYENAVNRQRVREGNEADFQAAPRQWGERKPGTMLVEHKDKLYLETKVEHSLGYTFFDANGNELSAEQVEPFLPTRSESSRQDTDKEILVRDYALESIRSLAIGGETYVMLQNVSVPMRNRILEKV